MKHGEQEEQEVVDITVSWPVMAPMKTVAEAEVVTQEACVPSLQSSSLKVQTPAAMTSKAILMDWKLYWMEKLPTAARDTNTHKHSQSDRTTIQSNTEMMMPRQDDSRGPIHPIQ